MAAGRGFDNFNLISFLIELRDEIAILPKCSCDY